MLRLLYFTANWCGPCRAFSPVADKVLSQFSDVDYLKVDVDYSPELTQKYYVTSVPTIVLERGGVLVDRRSGMMSESDLIKFIESNK